MLFVFSVLTMFTEFIDLLTVNPKPNLGKLRAIHCLFCVIIIVSDMQYFTYHYLISSAISLPNLLSCRGWIVILPFFRRRRTVFVIEQNTTFVVVVRN